MSHNSVKKQYDAENQNDKTYDHYKIQDISKECTQQQPSMVQTIYYI